MCGSGSFDSESAENASLRLNGAFSASFDLDDSGGLDEADLVRVGRFVRLEPDIYIVYEGSCETLTLLPAQIPVVRSDFDLYCAVISSGWGPSE